MHRRLCLILLWIAVPFQMQAAIPRWDALPALDVLHLQGPHAGLEVCPMCRHGYDAGLLVFLPTSTPPAEAGNITRALRATSARVGDERFRPFLILTGEAPSEAMLAAVASAERNWYVAHLASQALAAASRDFRTPLEGRALGYVFAQRRQLWAFEPGASDTAWMAQLADHAEHAMRFLHATYAQPAATDGPDTPKGRLWAAPAILSSKIALSKDEPSDATQACFSDDAGVLRADALLAISLPGSASPTRTWWARTDTEGCVSLRGAWDAGRMHAELFSPLLAVATAEIDAAALPSDAPLAVSISAGAPVAVTGHEPVVVPCEGCEAVFQGLPERLASSARLATAAEPGERLQLSGTVRNGAGHPQPGVIVYAYQTDASGRYPEDARLSGAAARHGRLRGWTRTDASGRYTFLTVRPGAYPGGSEPQHIHMHVIEPGRCTYYLGDVLFADDSLLTADLRAQQEGAFGGSGIVQPQGDADAGWRAIRDIALGKHLADHGRCSDPGPRG